jgi:CopG family transcriptional regulator, nickel-responsive regulator
MERVTIRLSSEFAEELTVFMRSHQYENRSEVIRDLARLKLKAKALESVAGRSDCVATFSCVFDRTARELPMRLVAAHHHHHGLQVATLHVHLDCGQCLEVAVLRGQVSQVDGLVGSITAERGVVDGAPRKTSLISTGRMWRASIHRGSE